MIELILFQDHSLEYAPIEIRHKYLCYGAFVFHFRFRFRSHVAYCLLFCAMRLYLPCFPHISKNDKFVSVAYVHMVCSLPGWWVRNVDFLRTQPSDTVWWNYMVFRFPVLGRWGTAGEAWGKSKMVSYHLLFFPFFGQRLRAFKWVVSANPKTHELKYQKPGTPRPVSMSWESDLHCGPVLWFRCTCAVLCCYCIDRLLRSMTETR